MATWKIVKSKLRLACVLLLLLSGWDQTIDPLSLSMRQQNELDTIVQLGCALKCDAVGDVLIKAVKWSPRISRRPRFEILIFVNWYDGYDSRSQVWMLPFPNGMDNFWQYNWLSVSYHNFATPTSYKSLYPRLREIYLMINIKSMHWKKHEFGRLCLLIFL